MNKYRNKHLIEMRLCSIVLITLLVGASVEAQTAATAPASKRRSDARSAPVVVSRYRLPLAVSGFRRMPANGTRTNVVRRSSASPDALAAMIETTLGGLKFPGGTLQAASAVGPSLITVAHDETLQGDGTSRSPLGIKVPLKLNGSLFVGGVIRAIPFSGNAVEVTGGINEFGDGANGVNANGGTNPGNSGGSGVLAQGGDSDSSVGGSGVEGIGGDSQRGSAGIGVQGAGGNSQSGRGGVGVQAIGGRSDSFRGGKGVEAFGGGSDNGDGGIGLEVTGGGASGNHLSGAGIIARAGTAFNGAESGFAGEFIGDVQVLGNVRVTGNLSKGGGSFKIDHPLDPANKYLSHSFVESPDMKNIYDGVAQLDARGEAVVALPDWFGALNRDFRYLLTPIGSPAPNLFIAEKIAGNRFRIAGGQPGLEVSWQVTGIRQDAYANRNRISVEQDKPERERGFYLHPDAFDQPEEKNVLMVQHPEIMRHTKEAPDKAQKEKL